MADTAGPNPNPNPKKPDAILCPRTYPFPVDDPRRLPQLKKLFAPVLGEGRVMVRQCGPRQSLITRFSEPDRNHRFWPAGRGRDGEEFYEWAKSDTEGVFFGHLTDDARAHIAEKKADLVAFDDPTSGREDTDDATA